MPRTSQASPSPLSAFTTPDLAATRQSRLSERTGKPRLIPPDARIVPGHPNMS